MLAAMSWFKGLTVKAGDGNIGDVDDCLFDDRTWKLRWIVVDTGGWLSGRKVLVHPSSFAPVHDAPDYLTTAHLDVRLTRHQVRDSPGILYDRPVSRQMQDGLYGYYGCDPLWGGGSYFGGYPGGLGSMPIATGRRYNEPELLAADGTDQLRDEADPHLRSATAVLSYHVQASDGAVGHVENFMIETDNWGIRYLVVDTKNWWPGKHVLLSPYAVKTIDWDHRDVAVDLSRGQVKASPSWQPAEAVAQAYEERLHAHYGWPGYGW